MTGQLRRSRSNEHLNDAINRAADEMREIAQRWEDRRTVERHTIAENYAKGRLSLVCNLHIRMSEATVGTCSTANKRPLWNREALISAVFTVNVPNKRDIFLGDQEPMFVFNVECVESPKRCAVSSLVWLYPIQNEVEDCFGGLMFQSTVDGRFKVIPGITDRERGVGIAGVSGVEFDIAHNVIERRSEIVNCISDSEKNRAGNLLIDSDLQNTIRSLRIVLDQNTVSARAVEDSRFEVEIIDVLIGPLDL